MVKMQSINLDDDQYGWIHNPKNVPSGEISVLFRKLLDEYIEKEKVK